MQDFLHDSGCPTLRSFSIVLNDENIRKEPVSGMLAIASIASLCPHAPVNVLVLLEIFLNEVAFANTFT